MTTHETGTVRLVDNRSDMFPHCLQAGPPLRLAAADVYLAPFLYAYAPETKATAHPLALSGDLHEIWQVLNAINEALNRHARLTEPPRDPQDEQCTGLYEEARGCIQTAAAYIKDLSVRRLQMTHTRRPHA